MIDNIFNTILSSAQGITDLAIADFLACTLVSLILGLLAAVFYLFRNNCNKGFVVTLALLPAVVQLVIMLVNGNLGAGLAVMGAFTLVRFRSIPGSAKDIAAVFFSMAIGLATGMGFLAIAALFTLIVGVMNIVYTLLPLGNPPSGLRQLKITIPETLDFEEVFLTILSRYTSRHELIQVRTVNMGSLYRLTYQVTLKPGSEQKQFIDELRTRNGNLEITLSRPLVNNNEL